MAGIPQTHDEHWPAAVAPAGAAAAAAPRGAAARVLTSPYLTLVSRLVLGLIFLLAGLTKLGVPASLTASINSYQMPLPTILVQAMAVGLPPIELGVGIWLLIGLFTRFSAAVSAGLLVIFLVALIGAVVRGIAADCGCFAGGSGNPAGMAVIRALGPIGTFLSNEQADWGTVLRDVILLAMAMHLVLVPSIFSIDALRRRGQAVVVDEVAAGSDEGAA